VRALLDYSAGRWSTKRGLAYANRRAGLRPLSPSALPSRLGEAAMTHHRTSRPCRAGAASERATVAVTGITARLVSVNEDAEAVLALIDAYATWRRAGSSSAIGSALN
jgi:hypothetical protein